MFVKCKTQSKPGVTKLGFRPTKVKKKKIFMEESYH